MKEIPIYKVSLESILSILNTKFSFYGGAALNKTVWKSLMYLLIKTYETFLFFLSMSMCLGSLDSLQKSFQNVLRLYYGHTYRKVQNKEKIIIFFSLMTISTILPYFFFMLLFFYSMNKKVLMDFEYICIIVGPIFLNLKPLDAKMNSYFGFFFI